MPKLAAVGFLLWTLLLFQDGVMNSPLSVGVFLALGIIGLLGLQVYLASRKAVDIRVLEEAVLELKRIGIQHEGRLQALEILQTRLVALQETNEARLAGIDKAIEGLAGKVNSLKK